MSKSELTVRIQAEPERGIEGNRFLAKQQFTSELYYVVVLADGVPVGQQSVFHRGFRWWVDDSFIAKAYRGGDALRVLRETVCRFVAERSDYYLASIDYVVASPEKVLDRPAHRELGITVEPLALRRSAGIYRYNVSALRPALQATG